MQAASSREVLSAQCEALGREPRVWLRVPGYVVRNYSPDLEESVLHHMTTVFLEEEPVFSGCGVGKVETSLFETMEMCRKFLALNLTLIALPEGSPGSDLQPVAAGSVVPLAGVNILRLAYSDDPPRPPPHESNKSLAFIQALVVCGSIYSKMKESFFERYGVNTVLDAAGLAVHPAHRRRGICCALLEARLLLCRELNISLTKTIFTSEGSQRAALKCGFHVVIEERYGDLRKEDGTLIFPHIPEDNKIIIAAKTLKPEEKEQ